MRLSGVETNQIQVAGKSYLLPSLTQSLCPECLTVIDALLFEDTGRVLMEKHCQQHGSFKELISSDSKFFLKMRRTHYEMPEAIENPQYQNTSQCPDGCGLCDQHVSRPAMLNIDLTNRCNMNCPICFASSNATGRDCTLTLEQVDRILTAGANMQPRGAACLQFLGGEPTIHKDFIEALKLARNRGFTFLHVATNGLKFADDIQLCKAASDAGLNQVYLQFDGLNDEIYLKMRGRRLMETKLKAIDNIRKTNMRVVLVPTIVKGINDHEVGRITQFAIDNIDVISTISWQPVSITGRIEESRRFEMRYTLADLAKDMQEQSPHIGMDMHRDWFPFSIVEPYNRLVELVTGTPQMRCSCHPHCGCATYLVVDKQTKKILPLALFVDIEPAMETLNKIASRLEKLPFLKKISIFHAMRSLKKHFHSDKSPGGWTFDNFLDFVNGFFEFSNQHEDKAGFMTDLRRQRFGTILMAAMHFQDVYNYEIDRSRHCIVLYGAPNGRFYPFCTWNSGPCHRYDVEKAYSKSLRETKKALPIVDMKAKTSHVE